MEMNGRIARQILLFSLLVLIIPMILFPERLGTTLAKASLVYVLFELVYYGIVSFILNRHASLVQLAQAAGLCIVYRFALGAFLGVFIVIAYPMDLSVALTLSMSSYLPAILLQIAATPFILQPAVSSSLFEQRRPRHVVMDGPQTPPRTSTATASDARARRQESYSPDRTSSRLRQDSTGKQTTVAAPAFSDANGFERATRYIGEDASVELAAVVDPEGLLLSHFVRGDIDPESWAPFAVVLEHSNSAILKRFGFTSPDKVELIFREKKVAIASEEMFSLLIVSERTLDEVLHIRINQALDIIRKYVAERYSEKLVGNAEKQYV